MMTAPQVKGDAANCCKNELSARLLCKCQDFAIRSTLKCTPSIMFMQIRIMKICLCGDLTLGKKKWTATSQLLSRAEKLFNSSKSQTSTDCLRCRKASQMALTEHGKWGMFEEKISTHSFFQRKIYGGSGVSPAWEWATERNDMGGEKSIRMKL